MVAEPDGHETDFVGMYGTYELALQAAKDWADEFINDKQFIADRYEKLGRETAETEEYTNSEDAWEAEETHYTLTNDEKEIAADAFGEGFISYAPQALADVMT